MNQAKVDLTWKSIWMIYYYRQLVTSTMRLLV